MKIVNILSTIVLSTIFLAGCMTQTGNVSKKVQISEKNEVVEVNFYWIKLYAKENQDSSKIIDSLNEDLKNNIDISKSLEKYGTVFIDTKFDLSTIEKEIFNFSAGNTLAYVSAIKDSKIIIDYYKTGVEGNLKLTKLDDKKYIVDYKVESSNLVKMESDSKNKITSFPVINKKSFFQTSIIETTHKKAVAINNTEAKQYEIIVLGVK
jgi:PBP1b-binding outer membrane lipoprotein LpoB